MRKVQSLPVALAAIAMALAGCSASSSEPAATAPSYEAVVRGEVDVVDGLVRIFAPRSGHIARAVGRLGQHVQTGDILASLDARAMQAELAVARAEAATAAARRQSAEAETRTGAVLLARLQTAAAADAASPQAVEEALAALHRQQATQRIAAAELAGAMLKVKVAEQSLDQLDIRAPVGGELVQARGAAFMRVSADDPSPLYILLPDGPRIVRAELNEEFAAQVHNGSPAEVVTEGPAAKTFKARSVRISAAMRHSASSTDGGEPVDARVIDCEIEIDAPGLRVGQQVLVRFMKDRA